MEEMTHKEIILKALHFSPYFTTPLYDKLRADGEQIGAKSLTNRLSDLQRDGLIVGEEVKGRAEKQWRIRNGELF